MLHTPKARCKIAAGFLQLFRRFSIDTVGNDLCVVPAEPGSIRQHLRRIRKACDHQIKRVVIRVGGTTRRSFPTFIFEAVMVFRKWAVIGGWNDRITVAYRDKIWYDNQIEM